MAAPSLPVSPAARAAAPSPPTVPRAVLEMRALFGALATDPVRRSVVAGVVIAAFVFVVGGMFSLVLGFGPGADAARSMRMDWTSPVTYGVVLALAAAVAAGVWTVLLSVVKLHPLSDAFARFAQGDGRRWRWALFGAVRQQSFGLSRQICADLKGVRLRFPSRDFGSGRPVRLTAYGSQIGHFVSAQDWAVAVAPTFVRVLLDRKPYQIEEFSREYVATKLESDIERRVAVCAYEFGTQRAVVQSVLWVVLRDELLRRVGQARG